MAHLPQWWQDTDGDWNLESETGETLASVIQLGAQYGPVQWWWHTALCDGDDYRGPCLDAGEAMDLCEAALGGVFPT